MSDFSLLNSLKTSFSVAVVAFCFAAVRLGVEMLLLRVLAAFWAADSIDEKKPEGEGPGVPFGPLSGVGVSGGKVTFDNLLGTIVVLALEPARVLRIAVETLFGEDVACDRVEGCGVCSEVGLKALLVGDWSGRERTVLVGVGGVLTMTGAG